MRLLLKIIFILIFIMLNVVLYSEELDYKDFNGESLEWYNTKSQAIEIAESNAVDLAIKMIGVEVESNFSQAFTANDKSFSQTISNSLMIYSKKKISYSRVDEPQVEEKDGKYYAKVIIRVQKTELYPQVTNLKQVAINFEGEKKYNEALVTYKLILIFDPSFLESYVDIIGIQAKLADFDGAIKSLSELVAQAKKKNNRVMIDRLSDIAASLKQQLAGKQLYINRIDEITSAIVSIKKSIYLGIGLSVLFPGAGQIYAESYIKGGIFMALGAGLLGSAIVTMSLASNKLNLRDQQNPGTSFYNYYYDQYKNLFYPSLGLFIGFGALWVYNWFDAYFTVSDFNETGGIAFVPGPNFTYIARPVGFGIGLENKCFNMIYSFRW